MDPRKNHTRPVPEFPVPELAGRDDPHEGGVPALDRIPAGLALAVRSLGF